MVMDKKQSTIKEQLKMNCVKCCTILISWGFYPGNIFCRFKSHSLLFYIIIFTLLLKNINGSPIDDNGNIKTNFCLGDTTIDPASNLILTWPRTKAGDVQISRELCLNWGWIPVTRRCKIDNTRGAFWSTVKGECIISDGKDLQRTRNLYKLLNSNQTDKDILSELINISKSFHKFVTVSDIVLTNRIFQKVSSLTSECVVIFDNLLLSANQDVFQTAQRLFNNNVDLLSTLQKCLNLNEINIDKSSFTTISVKLSNSKAMGWGLNSENKVVTLDSHLTEENIVEMVNNNAIRVGVFIKDSIMNELQMSDNFHDITLNLAFLFQYDLFVNDYDSENTYQTPIVYSYLKGYHENLDWFLTIFYKSRNKNEECRFKHDNLWILSPSQIMENDVFFCKMHLLRYYLFKTEGTNMSPIPLSRFNVYLLVVFTIFIIYYILFYYIYHKSQYYTYYFE